MKSTVWNLDPTRSGPDLGYRRSVDDVYTFQMFDGVLNISNVTFYFKKY